MALPARQQTLYWSIVAIVFIGIFWLLNDVLLPFILGAVIAYLLDPIADLLETKGLGRKTATFVIFITALVTIMPLTVFAFSIILNQLSALTSFSFSHEKVMEIETRLITLLPSSIGENLDLQNSLEDIAAFIRPRAEELFKNFGQNLLGTLLSSAVSLINILVLIVVVPVVTVYMLLDWDKIVERIDALIPRDHADYIRQLAKEIDATLSAFVRGMGSVCLILGIYYAFSLWMAGLSFGVAVGFFAGLVTFIPYLGSLMGGALALGLGIFEFWGEWDKLAIIAFIFFLGQLVEGNYLTPKLVGGSVGLHPVWLLLALSVFGATFGFVGMLIAVPFAASIGVLVRFGASQYTSGPLYKGKMAKDDEV